MVTVGWLAALTPSRASLDLHGHGAASCLPMCRVAGRRPSPLKCNRWSAASELTPQPSQFTVSSVAGAPELDLHFMDFNETNEGQQADPDWAEEDFAGSAALVALHILTFTRFGRVRLFPCRMAARTSPLDPGCSPSCTLCLVHHHHQHPGHLQHALGHRGDGDPHEVSLSAADLIVPTSV